MSETISYPDYEFIDVSVAEGVGRMILNRPHVLNALIPEMMGEIIAALELMRDDDAVRALLITGAGRAFSAGGDAGFLEKLIDARPFDIKETVYAFFGKGVQTLKLFPKPTVAAVNGPAAGVGVTMQLPMDIRIASTQARFGLVFTRRGVVMEACSSWFLPRIVGISQAMEWVMSGRVFPADEALKGGLVSQVVAPDDLLPTARAIAREIAENTSAVSVTLCRHMMWKMLGADHPMEAHKIDSRGIRTMGQLPDAYEGVQSFLEKRPGNYTMKPSTDIPDFFPWWEEREFE